MQSRLELEDGSVYEGDHFAAPVNMSGEVVFTTGMTGYVESLTDPSFAGQILVFTYPLLGNYGVPRQVFANTHLMANMESESIHVRGVVVSSVTNTPSHVTSHESLLSWLASFHIPGISGIDTRALTLKLREKGTMRGRIISEKNNNMPSLNDGDMKRIVNSVSLAETITYKPKTKSEKHVALIDCGVKHGILRALLSQGLTVTRIPWDADPSSMKGIDGVVCSNGPGDPKDCAITIGNIKKTVSHGTPFLGVCLGHQLLALAIGADTYKLPYGHRGLNQPCQDLFTKKAYVTSQNHGYAVDRRTIPSGFSEWFINLNDKTNEGLIQEKKKIWSTQFHPEGHPGPSDTDWVFTMFAESL